MPKIVIQTDHLTRSENLKIRVLLIKIALRKMKIRNAWTLFKLYFPNDNNEQIRKEFRLCLQIQSANEGIIIKLEQMVDMLINDKEFILQKR